MLFSESKKAKTGGGVAMLWELVTVQFLFIICLIAMRRSNAWNQQSIKICEIRDLASFKRAIS